MKKEGTPVSKKITLIAGIAGAALSAGLLASLPAEAATKSVWTTATSAKAGGGLDALVKAAQKEGTLNIIATPRDWADYGDAMDAYSKAFHIKIVSDNPDGSSAQEITAIKTTKNKAKMPDVVDIGASHVAEAAGIFANYKVINWNDIPSAWKDPKGNWFGGYAGKLALFYDTSVTPAPTKIKDLINPAYKGMIAIAGDPSSAQQSLITVFAASVANGGSVSNIQPGIDLFKTMKANGNFVNVLANTANFAAGAYKISLGWDYNARGSIAAAATVGKTVKWVYPTDAVVQGTPYVLAINKTAPHPAAARLWEEYMFSQSKGKLATSLGTNDWKKYTGTKLMSMIIGGQNTYIMGGAHPITEPAMAAKKLAVKPPSDVVIPARMPKAVFPNVAQQTAATVVLTAAWPNL
jgi:putative spermidine/putrescine transport system substrate-binding protein